MSIRIRQKPVEKFSKLRTMHIREGIQAVIGFKEGTKQIQSFVFDKTKFNLTEAKTWVKENKDSIADMINLKEDDVTEPNRPTTEGTIVPEGNLEDLFDVKHATNGRVDKEKVLNELSKLTNLKPYVEPKSYNKMTEFLKTKMKESHVETLRENGFNLLEGESTLTADCFDHTSISLQESVNDSPNGSKVRRALVRLIHSGESKNGNQYSGKCLKNAAHLFEGLPIYPNHVDGERSVTDKAGFYSNVEYIGNENEGELRAVANILESEKKLWDLIKEQHIHPKAKLCGFSINAFGKGKIINKNQRIVEEIVIADSTDVVDKPSAGGKVLQLLESIKNTINQDSLGEEDMDIKTLKEKHPDLVALIESEAKPIVLQEAFEEFAKKEDKKMSKCPHCSKEFPMKESVEHSNEHIKELSIKLNESVTQVNEFKRTLSIANLEKAIGLKLKENKDLSDATKKRLVGDLIALGEEVREGDKPSNWDLKITEELNYANELKGATKDLKLGSEMTETKTQIKLTEKEQKEISDNLLRSL